MDLNLVFHLKKGFFKATFDDLLKIKSYYFRKGLFRHRDGTVRSCNDSKKVLLSFSFLSFVQHHF